MDVFTPHDPTTVDLCNFFLVNKWMIGMQWFVRTRIHWARKSQQPLVMIWTIEMRNIIGSESILS